MLSSYPNEFKVTQRITHTIMPPSQLYLYYSNFYLLKLDCLNCEKALYFTTYAPTLSPGIQPDRPPLLDHLIPIWS